MIAILENFKKKLLEGNISKSDAEKMGDFFELGDSPKEDLIHLLPFMIRSVPSIADEDTQERFLWAIDQAILFNRIAKYIDWDPLVPYLPSLSDENKSYILGFLGFSGKRKYLPLVNKYLHYPNDEVIDAAKEAISEILSSSRNEDSTERQQ